MLALQMRVEHIPDLIVLSFLFGSRDAWQNVLVVVDYSGVAFDHFLFSVVMGLRVFRRMTLLSTQRLYVQSIVREWLGRDEVLSLRCAHLHLVVGWVFAVESVKQIHDSLLDPHDLTVVLGLFSLCHDGGRIILRVLLLRHVFFLLGETLVLVVNLNLVAIRMN